MRIKSASPLEDLPLTMDNHPFHYYCRLCPRIECKRIFDRHRVSSNSFQLGVVYLDLYCLFFLCLSEPIDQQPLSCITIHTTVPFCRSDTLFSSFSVLMLILKTPRVARLIPPMKVVDLAARINLHWYLVRLTPTFYWNLSQRRRRMNKEAEVKKDMAARPSGGGLLIATIATLKAMKEREDKIKEEGKLVYGMYLLKKWAENSEFKETAHMHRFSFWRRSSSDRFFFLFVSLQCPFLTHGNTALRFLHILPNTNIEMNRHIAATRIQRVWRNRSGFYDDAYSEDEGSQAWISTRDGLSSSLSLDFKEILSRQSRLFENNSIHRDSIPGEPVDQGNTTARRKMKRRRGKKKVPSQVGKAMAEMTGQWVTLFLFANLLVAVLFTYVEHDTTDASTMVILHGQTTNGNMAFAEKAVDTARRSTIPNLYSYSVLLKNKTSSKNENVINLTWPHRDMLDLREYEIRSITVKDGYGESTGLFNIKKTVDQLAMMELFLLAFVLLTWFLGVAAFAAPIMSLVIVPIERAVKLLSILVMDPLGYQNSLQYKNFLTEADQIAANNGRWTREVLKGMETEFLMSTIVRIGSLMKVGFGSAGVKIIRNNLEKNHGENTGPLLLNSQGSMVSCIFLFCDIRSFTDATECLQEEVFVFTNQIAAVVHSICSSYGGSANKNIGDAFLISWKLDHTAPRQSFKGIATHFQADKALFSVVKICMALHHDDHYVDMLSEHAKEKLLNKLKDRPGPTVQLGFGLHAGKAVEGAIGSQRKIDATYVSMAVERAEYLESSTKKYKVPMLMSDSFHRLLQPRRRKRCRKIDSVMFENENDHLNGEGIESKGKMMDLFTYDVDIDALWNDTEGSFSDSDDSSGELIQFRESQPGMSYRISPDDTKLFSSFQSPRSSVAGSIRSSIRSRGSDITAAIAAAAAKAMGTRPSLIGEATREEDWKEEIPELVLPTGRAFYSENLWLQADIRRIRRRYTTKIFERFNLGLQKYYSKQWDEAKAHFEAILDSIDDGPSIYFLGEMRKHDGKPPPGFQPYGKA